MDTPHNLTYIGYMPLTNIQQAERGQPKRIYTIEDTETTPTVRHFKPMVTSQPKLLSYVHSVPFSTPNSHLFQHKPISWHPPPKKIDSPLTMHTLQDDATPHLHQGIQAHPSHHIIYPSVLYHQPSMLHSSEYMSIGTMNQPQQPQRVHPLIKYSTVIHHPMNRPDNNPSIPVKILRSPTGSFSHGHRPDKRVRFADHYVKILYDAD